MFKKNLSSLYKHDKKYQYAAEKVVDYMAQ